MGFRPVFFIAGRGMEKDHIGRTGGSVAGLMRGEVGGDGVIARAGRHVIAQAGGEQLANTLNRVLPNGNSVAHVVEPAGARLSGTFAIQTMLFSPGVAGHQRGAFEQALRVDNPIVTTLTQQLFEIAAFLTDCRAKPIFPPTSEGYRNNAIDGGMP